MRKIIGLVIALLALPGLALASNNFTLTTAAATAGNMYSATSSNPMGCMNTGANTAYIALDGTAATTTNGIILQANGGWANIDQANASISGISSGGNTTVVCYPGIRFTAGSTNPASAAAGTFRSWAGGATAAVVSNSAANFFPFLGTETAVASTSEGTMATLAPTVATIKNLTCVLTTIAGVVTVAGGTNYVIALRQNIASSTLTCTIAAAASSCTDVAVADKVTTAINDQLDYIITPSGTPTALVPHCSVEVDI